MIQPLRRPGAAFTLEADGDQKNPAQRGIVAEKLGISSDWATVRQVHGRRVVEVAGPGHLEGGADGLFTRTVGLPVAVMAADCAGVVVGGDGGVGVAHAGWRGVAAGVVTSLLGTMRSGGVEPTWAAVGPFIGPCCFEVGPDVSRRFPSQRATSRRGRLSVDLGRALAEQLRDVPTWWSERCTVHQPGCFSHRRDRALKRMAAIGWFSP
ncbi:MAG: polyphenol oxidase family protein [bacterium]|nr:polyphenol oxidase family protein [bacterium]